MTEEHRSQESGQAEAEDARGANSRPRKLYRSGSDRVLGGVCGGLGQYFDVDPLLFRVGWVVLTLMGGVGVPAYIAAWIFLPEDPAAIAARSQNPGGSAATAKAPDPERSRKLGLLAGAVLVCLGAGLLFDEFGWYYLRVPHFLRIDLDLIVPLILVGFGIYLIANRGGVRLKRMPLRAATGSGKRLQRSVEDRRIAGVCGGLADYFGVDSTWVRLGAIFLALFTHLIGVLAYLAWMIALPEEPRDLGHGSHQQSAT
jgi:phage shock protein C